MGRIQVSFYFKSILNEMVRQICSPSFLQGCLGSLPVCMQVLSSMVISKTFLSLIFELFSFLFCKQLVLYILITADLCQRVNIQAQYLSTGNVKD